MLLHSLLEKCKSKLQWGITSYQSEWLSSKKCTNNKHWRGCGEKGTPLHCSWECKLIQPLWRTVWRFLKKTGSKTSIWPNSPTTGHIPWGNQNWKRHTNPNVHCSTIYNSWDIKETYIAIDKWMAKEDLVHIKMEYYSAIKRNAFDPVLMRWMNLQSIKQSEVNWKDKNKYHILTHMCGI